MSEATTPPAASPAPAIIAPPAAADPKAPPAAEQAKPPEPVKPATQKDAARFAALARRERELVAAREAIAKERESLKAKMAQLDGVEKAKASAKANPLALLKEHGLTYEDLTNFVLNGEKPSADLLARGVDEKLEAFKREQAQAQEKAAAAQKAEIEKQRTEAVARFRTETVEWVKARPEEYELVHLHEAHALVPQLIEAHYEKTGKLLSEKDAADQVESYLDEQVQKSLKSKRLAGKFAPVAAAPTKAAEPAARTTTLTNDLTPISTPPPAAALTEKERIKRALAAYDAAKSR